MQGKIYLHFLILCGIWFTTTYADEEIRGSSDNLVRQKRVISRIEGEDVSGNMADTPYIVKIKQNNRFNCAGTILSNHVVITVYECVSYEVHQYQVYSGSIRLEHGNPHNVTDIRKKLNSHPHRSSLDGIALLTVNPPFIYGQHGFRIELHTAPLLPGTLGTISGWGYNYKNGRPIDRGTCFPRSLRSIVVPIMSHRECVEIYRPHNIPISDSDICTFDRNKSCGHSDGGAPLVIDGYLVGLHLWTGPGRSLFNPEYPDVFALVQHSEYNQWIRTNIVNIETQFHNNRH